MWPISQLRLGIVAFIGLAAAWISGVAGAAPRADQENEALAAGKELFTREWLQGDKRSFAGDGLGPVFNAKSCVACHSQGGIGGSGANANNATIVSVFVDLTSPGYMAGVPIASPDPNVPVKQPDREKLAGIHPALRTESCFPVHRFGADEAFQEWRSKHLGRGMPTNWQHNQIAVDGVRLALIPSRRNAPALFGSGLIDRIPESVIEKTAAEQAATLTNSLGLERLAGLVPTSDKQFFRIPRQSLPIAGRTPRLVGDRIGKFGWKGNVATLREFTLQACANELGLEAPGFPRAAPPWVKDYKAPGLDISVDQANSLVKFVASLPRPVIRAAEAPNQVSELAAGQRLFSSMGCAVCHRPMIGEVDGIYSDLLLHDMGQSLSGAGFYGTNVEFVKSNGKTEPLPIDRDESGKPTKEKPPKFGAAPREWRTPPLWGLRDSAPYLHDGRANTITNAILSHDGEGAAAAEAFEKLADRERNQVELFLQSLAAPSPENR